VPDLGEKSLKGEKKLLRAEKGKIPGTGKRKTIGGGKNKKLPLTSDSWERSLSAL
jgi:hypothetical protein